MRKTCMNCSLITCHRYEQEVGYCDAHIPKQPVREPQCKTTADLHREWARVLDMCTAKGFDRPWECVKVLLGSVWLICGKGSVDLDFDNTPHCPPEHREFAIAIIEGKPAFRGDIAFTRMWTIVELCALRNDGRIKVRLEGGSIDVFSADELLLDPPKPKIISINGVDVPAPNHMRASNNHDFISPYEWVVGFNNEQDQKVFIAAIEGKKP